MERVPYLAREHVKTQEETAVFDRLERERSMPTPNIFRAIANAPLQLEGMLTYAAALRQAVELGPQLRELVILAIGAAKKGSYIVVHHQKDALKAGYTQEQVEAISQGRIDERLFSEAEIAVLRFGRAIGEDAEVTDELWSALAKDLTARQLVQLTLTASWYCSGMITARVLRIGLESNAPRT